MANELLEVMGEFTECFQGELRGRLGAMEGLARLSERDRVILEYVYDNAPVRFAEVAEFIRARQARGSSASAVSNAISTLLSEHKLVRKEVDPEDQRQPIISLSAKGKALAKKIRETQGEVVELVERSMKLSVTERKQLLAIFQRGLTNFRKAIEP
jgi:DNA-binding MarR family transcriptional regulator